MLAQAFARGSGQLDEAPPVAPERTEHSVMEGLPPAKAERIAAMRRELADLQRQLIEAQQRIATELQGRAEDAERFEALEARLQAQEVKAQEDTTRNAELVTEVANLRSQLASVAATAEELRRDVASRGAQTEEAKTLLAKRDGELATRTAERDSEQATRARLEKELEDQATRHREITSKLESELGSLRDASALLATRDAELTAIMSERDVLKGELAAARARARDVANQLARFGQDLMEGVGDGQAASSSESPPSVTARSAERPKPPPTPLPRVAAEPRPVETILEVTEEPRSRPRIGLVLISGVIVGSLATIAFVKWNSSGAATADERHDPGFSPHAALVAERASERASEPAPPSAMHIEVGAEPGASSAQPTPSSDTDVSDGPKVESEPRAIAPVEIPTKGVIVLPPEAEDHRVFVDGRVVPVKDSRAVVRCGAREIRIGSRGTPRTFDVACGGETAVPADTRRNPK